MIESCRLDNAKLFSGNAPMLKKLLQVDMDKIFKPFNNYGFYSGVLLGILLWCGVRLYDFIVGVLLQLPGVLLLSTILVFFLLDAMSKWASPSNKILAMGDKLNFGPLIAALIAGSGHALVGCGLIALLHYLTHGLIAGSNMQFFILSMCIAPCFYWFAWQVRQATPRHVTYFCG